MNGAAPLTVSTTPLNRLVIPLAGLATGSGIPPIPLAAVGPASVKRDPILDTPVPTAEPIDDTAHDINPLL